MYRQNKAPQSFEQLLQLACAAVESAALFFLALGQQRRAGWWYRRPQRALDRLVAEARGRRVQPVPDASRAALARLPAPMLSRARLRLRRALDRESAHEERRLSLYHGRSPMLSRMRALEAGRQGPTKLLRNMPAVKAG